ncbi:MAG: GEVED domain-containing protein, partial [Bacteroidota bacterium]
FNTNLCPYGSGGAIYLKQAPGTTHSGGLKVTNATFYGNFCNVVGSVVFTDNAQFNGSNLISWGSTTVPDRGEFSSINGGTSDVTYSLLQSVNCATAGITGCSTDIFNKDPLFIDVNNYNFHLPMCSPAVNTGSVTNSMLTDYDGNPRPYNDGTGATDMGAYEFQGTPPNNFYQDKDGDGYGITTYKIKACTAPPGFAALPGDCNDFDAEINPGHAEICDGKDNNCNNLVDYLDPTYIDNTPPSFTTPAPANLVLTCTDQIPAPAILLATDNCTPNPSVTLTTNSTRSNDPNNCAYYSYSITRTWTAKDLKNNTASVSQVITVKDDQPPVFNQISPNVTISCDQAIPGYIPPSATDNCSGVTVTMETVTTRSADPNDCAYYTYTITRTWTAKDRCNNATTAQQIITVQDTKAPYVLFPPAPQVYVECDEAIPQITSLTSQDCDAHPIFKLTEETETFEANPSDHIFQRITRHISLTDHCGNHVDYQQIVNIRDRKPPVITNCPKDITVQGTEDGAAVNFPAAIVTESCGYELYYTPNEPGGTFPIGTTEESIDAYDKGGNYTSCTFKVTVLDDFKVHCQDDIFVDVPFGSNPDRNTVNWNPPFAKACSFCDSQEAQADFQQDFRPLGNLNGHRYYISKQKNTPAESALACAERQGYLVSIGDKTENRFLTNELAGQSILIGLSDKIQESNFIWADGQNTGFSNWAANNPVTGANAQSRDFVRLGADGRWLNVGNDTAFFVCEVNCYDIKKMAGNIPANHALPTGNFKETYTLTDMCGRTDTCGQNVYVYRNEQSYCTPNIYPSALDQDTTLWIKSFKMGNLSQETGNNKGYYRHPNLAETFETGKSYTLDVVTASNQNGPTNSYVRVWIDLNADRDFYDAGELLIDTFLPSGVLHTTLQIPSNTRLGNLRQRLRVATSRFAAPEACGDYIIGETEDYRVAFRTPDFSNDQTAARSNKSESGALLYPNPASNVAWVSLQGDSDAACTIQLMSVNGAILRTLNVPAGETNPQRLDLSGLAAGVYFVQIHQDGQAVQMEKLVVEKE